MTASKIKIPFKDDTAAYLDSLQVFTATFENYTKEMHTKPFHDLSVADDCKKIATSLKIAIDIQNAVNTNLLLLLESILEESGYDTKRI